MSTRAKSWDRSVVGKAAAILMTFRNGCRHTMTEIATATGIPLSTTHRLLADLASWQLLERTAEGDYELGPPLKHLTTSNRPSRRIDALAQSVLHDLSEVTGSAVRLGVLLTSTVAFMEKHPGHLPASFSEERCAPAHATAMGKALLAFSPPQVVQCILRQGLEPYTPFTITTRDRLRRSLVVVRQTQVAISRSELAVGRNTIAVPVFGAGGHIAAAIEVSLDDVASELPSLTPALIVAGRSLNRELVASPADDSRLPDPFSHMPRGGSRPRVQPG